MRTRWARDCCPQPGTPALTGLSVIDIGPHTARRTAAGPSRAKKGPFSCQGSPNAPLSFPRSAPTGWAQRLAGRGSLLCPRRPTGRRHRSATRRPQLLPRTFSRPTSRRPTRSRHCPTARRPTPPPLFPTWPGTHTAAWRPWRSHSLLRPPGPRPAQPPAPTTSRPDCWRRPPALWASTRAVTTLPLCPGSCTAWPTARTAWPTGPLALPGWRRHPAWRICR